jgi:hypothetical protein
MNAKTPEELAEMTSEQRKAHFLKEEEIVFGVGFQRDKQGRPVEVGIGSSSQQTHNHLVALEKERARQDERKAILLAVAKGDAG